MAGRNGWREVMTQDDAGRFARGTLLALTREATVTALRSGSLAPIDTVATWHRDQGMDFLLRRVSSLRRKPRASMPSDPTPTNPFLPFDPAMFVTELSDSHLALLNKFPVVDHHLLIVTREFVRQTDPLEPTDFQALAMVLRDFDSLGFYNSGSMAGASQPHRHLQVIPLPLDSSHLELAIETRLGIGTDSGDGLSNDQGFDQTVQASTHLRFAHRWTPLCSLNSPALHSAYHRLLEAYDWNHRDELPPYNLLIRPRWMMLIPRRAEVCVGVSLNAMAYAGQLLVKTAEEEAALLEHGLMQALTETAGVLR